MTDEAVSPLRRRMIEDMTIRKLAPKTQHDYVQRVKNFAAFLGRSPDTASFEDVRRYQLHLATSGVGVPTINQTVSTEPGALQGLHRGQRRTIEEVRGAVPCPKRCMRSARRRTSRASPRRHRVRKLRNSQGLLRLTRVSGGGQDSRRSQHLRFRHDRGPRGLTAIRGWVWQLTNSRSQRGLPGRCRCEALSQLQGCTWSGPFSRRRL